MTKTDTGQGHWQVTLDGGPELVPELIEWLEMVAPDNKRLARGLIASLREATHYKSGSMIDQIRNLATAITGDRPFSESVRQAQTASDGNHVPPRVTDNRKLSRTDRDLADEAVRRDRAWEWWREYRRVADGNVLQAVRLDDPDKVAFPPAPFPGDCGLDLATTKDLNIWPGQSKDVPCGVTVALPPGTFGWITGRSSAWSRLGLWVMPGIIDEGWRGELRAMVYRPDQSGVPEVAGGARVDGDCLHIPAGTRIAQMIVLPNMLGQIRIEQVDKVEDLPYSERGTSGFGSSG
jgi:dUTP pyrophosphatase